MDIRNIAIVAHVDHGKTTLVDSLLKASTSFDTHKGLEVRAIDSTDQEKERGITIYAKIASIGRSFRCWYLCICSCFKTHKKFYLH